MAAAKYHVLAGFVTFAIFAAAYHIHFNYFKEGPSFLTLLSDYKWVTLGLFLSLFGSTLSDYDLLYKYLSPWHHRSAVTHSALIPTIALLIYLYPTHLQDYVILVVCFMLGFASHLFLDGFPTVDIEKLIKKMQYKEAAEEVASSLRIGLTPVECLSKEDRRKLSGTFNIHFPQKSVSGRR